MEKKSEEKLEKEEIPVPLYFDRYVTSELRALGQRITDLKENMDERFAQVDNHFREVNRRLVEFKGYMDERFAQVDRRFSEVDRRFVELKEDVDKRFDGVDKRFDKLDATLKWVIGLVIGLFSPIIVGILAIIIKMFIFGK